MPNRWLARGLTLVLLVVAGAVGQGERASAEDLPVGVPPTQISGVAANYYQGQLILSWQNPASVDWTETIVRAQPGTVAPATSAQGLLVYAGRQSSTSVSDLDPGTPYAFSFWARDLEGLQSRRVSLQVSGAKVTMNVTPTQVVSGQDAEFTVTVRDLVTDKPLADREVSLFGRRPGTQEVVAVGSGRTTRQGKASITIRPSENFDYAAVYFGEGANLGGYSADLNLPVAFLVTAKPSATIVRVGQIFTVLASVDPATSGHVVLEELVKGKWTKLVTRKLDDAGKATLRFNANASGTHTYRFRKAGTERYAAGTSKTFTITAR